MGKVPNFTPVFKKSMTTLSDHCGWLSFLGGSLSSMIYTCLRWKTGVTHS